MRSVMIMNETAIRTLENEIRSLKFRYDRDLGGVSMGRLQDETKELQQAIKTLQDSEVVASGKVKYKSGKVYLDSGIIKYTKHSGWLIGGTKIPKCYQHKLMDYNGKNIIISIKEVE